MKNKRVILKQAVKDKNVEFLVKYYFNVCLSQKQKEIVRDIAFLQHKRLTISAMTRYGKTYCVALAVGLIILMSENKKIALIAPQSEQAQILRNYMTDLIVQSKSLLKLAQLQSKGDTAEKLQKEASRKRQTFRNGCEYRVYSASGDANRLMGFGADVVIKDEACLISSEANAKITRMLGDNPEESALIELYNPWDRDNVAFEHSIDPRFKHYKIDYNIAIQEGRTTKQFIDEQRKELTPLEFEVLYESDFPEQPEDAVFSLSEVQKAINLNLDLETEFKLLKEKHDQPFKYSEKEFNKVKEGFNKFQKLVSCDVADKGLDETVIFWGYQKENKYQIVNFYNEPKSENMKIARKLIDIAKEFGLEKIPTKIRVDSIGAGVGVVSRLRELKDEENLNIQIEECHSGEKALDSNRFLNKKAENYFRIKSLISDEQLDIKDFNKLKSQLINIKWEFNSSGKIKIVDPEEKSPDYSDALMFFIWKGDEFSYGFLDL